MWKRSIIIGVVRSTFFEFDTKLIFEQAKKDGKKIVVPKSPANKKMGFYSVDDNTEYEVTTFDVEEPLTNELVLSNSIDLIILPGILFNSNGYRIGFGGGYYDRYLKCYDGAVCSLVFHECFNNSWRPNI